MDTQAPQQQSSVLPQQGVAPVAQQPVAQPPMQQSVPPIGQPSAQPVQEQQPLRQPQPSAQPIVGVGGAKEAPIMQTTQEWIAPSTPEVVLHQEVKDAGVEAKINFPQLTSEQKAAGLKVAKEATEVKPLEQTVLNTKTPRESLEILKQAHKKVTEGFSWLVRLIIKEQDKKEREPVV